MAALILLWQRLSKSIDSYAGRETESCMACTFGGWNSRHEHSSFPILNKFYIISPWRDPTGNFFAFPQLPRQEKQQLNPLKFPLLCFLRSTMYFFILSFKSYFARFFAALPTFSLGIRKNIYFHCSASEEWNKSLSVSALLKRA